MSKEKSTMKKTFQMDGPDCANCARKMQDAISRLDGVESCTVSFLTQKLTIEAADDRFDGIVKQAVKCIKRVDPDCEVLL